MGQIVISGEEVVSTLHANALIPHQVMNIGINGEEIKIRVRTQWPVLKSVPVTMRFAGFCDGQLILQLATNRLTDRLRWLIDKMLESFDLEASGGRWEYPRLYIDINRLIQGQLRGMAITDIVVRDGLFHITTMHTNGLVGGTDSPEQDDADAGEELAQ
jgi:hypothetical protein